MTGERLHTSDADYSHAMKVNDIYLEDPAVRAVALSARIGALLTELPDGVPVMCNTLYLPRGSQQADHLDTLFMTPRTPDKLVATWMRWRTCTRIPVHCGTTRAARTSPRSGSLMEGCMCAMSRWNPGRSTWGSRAS
ncbi:MAG: hypothetical protein ACRENL_00555 [Candidatus Dormibacteria bacterium]